METFSHFCDPLLSSLWYVHASFVPRSQYLIQNFWCGLISAFPDLRERLFLTDPMSFLSPFAGGGIVHLWSAHGQEGPSSSSLQSFAVGQFPTIPCVRLFLPKCRIWCLLNSMNFLSSHFSTLLRSLWMARWLWCISHSSRFCIICAVPSPKSLMKQLHRIGPAAILGACN